ncbi:hypothetical protein LTR56_018444 [Elasticomyces elasticus]|nr:hypothetical protein LTR22_026541 [Elasticomyces elasticus]KAK3628723.1 hypothetical protein LTR56_018444 [Elasticomyces elasticus]KAK4908388.1 hypothetical protein LTR49_022701 [Elasticomyces elasticus]KAK5751716.1 hypothetical protein LTS12_018191 [Elasticomyces elasticus]
MKMQSEFQSTILITGGTTGLGYECALAIAARKPDTLVLICARSADNNAAATINRATRQDNVEYLHLDLAHLKGVRQFSSDFTTAHYPPLSAVVFNAALQTVGEVKYTADGLETTFGISHVGHALLFHLLLQHFTSDARVVITSSGTHDPAQKTGMPDAHYLTAEELAHPDKESTKKNSGRQRYTTTKLCNVLWLYALDRHRAEKGLLFTVTGLDPGLMPGTGLAREANPIQRFLWHEVLPRILPLLRSLISPNIHTPRESGQALARLAIGDDVAGVSGKYFEGMKAIKSSQDSYSTEKQNELWEWTVLFIAENPTEEKGSKELQIS